MKNKFVKKIIAVMLIAVIPMSVGACGKKQKVDDLAITDKDKVTNISIVTETREKDPVVYDTADSIILDSRYKEKNNFYNYMNAKHVVLPKDFNSDKNATRKIFDDMEKDKELNAVVLSAKQKGLLPYAKELKKKRKDIMVISAQLPENDRELTDSLDLNFKFEYPNRGVAIADMARTLNSDRFFAFVKEGKIDSDMKNILKQIKEKSKELNMTYEEINVPESDKVSENAFVANKIDYLVDRYGEYINIFPTDRDMDEVLLTKVLTKNFRVAQLSQPCSLNQMASIYGINIIPRNSQNYEAINSLVYAFCYGNYKISQRISTLSSDPYSFELKFAAELAANLNAKGFAVKKAYNSYYLEQISSQQMHRSCGFITKYKGVGNFKIVLPDPSIF